MDAFECGPGVSSASLRIRDIGYVCACMCVNGVCFLNHESLPFFPNTCDPISLVIIFRILVRATYSY